LPLALGAQRRGYPVSEEVVFVSQRSVQVVIYREGDTFVAQCLDVDVASDGPTETEARESLREALELYFDEPAGTDAFEPVGEAHVEQLTLKSA
jgi:predicted RNase H-like HicB family nuclease